MTLIDSTKSVGNPIPKKNSNQKRHARRWVPYAGALLLIALIVAGLWPRPIPVETARVNVGSLRSSVNEEGKTRIKHRYVISAPVGGQLRRIPFKAGAEVKAGETVLAVIDPLSPALLDVRARSLAEARKDSAVANLEKARAAYAFAQSDFQRFQQLFSKQTVSAQELETMKLRQTSAANDQAAAEGALRQAEAELAEFSPLARKSTESSTTPIEVVSPITGRILRVMEENARVVSPGLPLLEVGNPADLEVVIEVLSRDGAIIVPGSKVECEQWGGKDLLLGKVQLVEPAAFTKVSALGVEEQRVKVIADLVTPLEQRSTVGDQFRVEAKIIIWETERTLKVPAGALFRRGEKWATFVIDNGKAMLREIEVGRSSGTETEVLRGLKEGDVVILYPGSRVNPGQSVRPIVI
jgi:HlyD family secretion protein